MAFEDYPPEVQERILKVVAEVLCEMLPQLVRVPETLVAMEEGYAGKIKASATDTGPNQKGHTAHEPFYT